MDYLCINGGYPLSGTVTISGAKNAAIALLPATLLSDSPCTIENLPQIDDVFLYENILRDIGAVTKADGDKMSIDHSHVHACCADSDKVRSMRASYYLLGAGLGKFHQATVALPGGCEIGSRPMDLHFKGFRALGATIDIEDGLLKANAPQGLTGAEIYLDFASVGATINIMLAAVRAKGQTIIANAAKEPHVVDVANFLNCMGASVRGAGTDMIRIQGRDSLSGTSYAVIPDQVEAGTYMIAAAATGGDVILRNVIPLHLEAVSAKLIEMGVFVTEGDDGNEFFIRVKNDRSRLRSANLRTLPYPGFPTDLQQPMMALLTCCEGTGIVLENIYEDRYKHVPELERMGANISVDGRVAVIEGISALHAANVSASDLRAGAALVIAGLMAEGETVIDNVQFIDRGYEFIVEKLCALGADIRRVSSSSTNPLHTSPLQRNYCL